MLKLNDDTLLERRSYVGGRWTETPSIFSVNNPSDGSVVAQVADMGIEELRAAIDAAYGAQKAWAAKTAIERADLLMKWHALIIANQDDLARILTAEMGKPLAEARGEIAYGAGYIRWFAEEARRTYGDIIPGHMPDKRILVMKQPVGVVASITPWNFPNAMIARKVAPALAAGCTFVSRPSEKTPLSALALAVLAERAGFPEGVLSILASKDGEGFGVEMCHNTKVRKLTFTGSTRVGRLLMQQCANDIKKLSLELGGNAPFIVFDDADVDAAVDGVMVAKFRNLGQTCVCANRIYVQSAVHDAFVEKLVARLEKTRQGNPLTDEVDFGPMIDEASVTKVRAQLKDAVSKGARIELGGDLGLMTGTFFQPTVVTGATSDMLVMHEETFGPIAPIFRFDSEAEVISAANDTEFGLASYVYSSNLSRVFRVCEALEYGIVGANTGLISTPEAPFGGIKSSGTGREGSKYGIDDYLELKYLCLGVS